MRLPLSLLLSILFLTGCRSDPPSSDIVSLSQTPLLKPPSGPVLSIRGPFTVEHDGYTVCYDGRTKNPIWVYEVVSKGDLDGEVRRSDNFRPDPDLPNHVCSCLGDYRGSGFDRGHLAAAANHKGSKRAMDATFFLSNISPQASVGFNRQGGLWAELEDHVRDVVRESGRAHVVSGPLYLPDGERVSYPVLGKGAVAVPTHFFKAVFAERAGKMGRAEAWILPNRPAREGENYSSFSVPLMEVMRSAGLEIDTH